MNPLFSQPTFRYFDPIYNNLLFDPFPGWNTGHTGAYSLVDTIHADVSVSNAALRVIADIPLPAGTPAPSSRPTVTIASDHISGIAGATIHFANLADSLASALIFGPVSDLSITALPGLSVQLPGQVPVATTVENSPAGCTTQVSTVLSPSDTTFTSGEIVVLATTGTLVLGYLYGVATDSSSSFGEHFYWPLNGVYTGNTFWSDGISASKITIGDHGTLQNIQGAVFLRGDSHNNTATITTIDGRNDASRSNVRFTQPYYDHSPINGVQQFDFNQQVDGLAPAPIYFGSFYQKPHLLNVYGSPNSTYDVVSSPLTMKLYAGEGSTVTARWPALSVIGASTVHAKLESSYQIPYLNYNVNPPLVPELSVEQDPAHPHVVDLQIDSPQSFNTGQPYRLDSAGGVMRVRKTNPNNFDNTPAPDSWRVVYKSADVHATLNDGVVTIADTGAAGTTVATSRTVNVFGTTYPLEIHEVKDFSATSIVMGQSGNMQAIAGDVNISGSGGSVQYDNSADTVHRDIHLVSDVDGNIVVTGMSPGKIKASNNGLSPNVLGGPGGSTFFIDSRLPLVNSSFFSILGKSASDLAVGPNLRNTWRILGSNNTFFNNVVLSGVPNLRGGSDTDTFAFGQGFSSSGLITGNIDGGPGVDSVYYFSGMLSGSDVIDLPNHIAPRVQGQALNLESSGDYYILTVSNPGTISVPVGAPMSPVTIFGSFGIGPKVFSATGLPNGVTIDSQTGVISGTPTAENYSATVTVTVVDDSGTGFSSFLFKTVPGFAITPVSTQTSSPDSPVNLQIQVNSIFGGAATYSATNLPTGLAINSQTGLISGTIPESALANSPYHVTISATDGTHSASINFDWKIIQVLTILNPGNQDTPETVPIRLPIQVKNGVGPITYSATGLPGYLTIDSQTGVISGSIANYWYYYHQIFTFSVTVYASDSQQTVSTSFNWTVEPGFFASGIYDRTNNVGETVVTGIGAYDPYNGGAFTYDVTGLPPGLTVDNASGLVQGRIDNFADSGSPYHTVVTFHNTVFHYDYSMGFDWTVTPSLIIDNPGDQNSSIGEQVSLDLNVVRDLGRPIVYTAYGLPFGLSIDQNTGHISGTVGPQESSPSHQNVQIYARDGISELYLDFFWHISSPAANTIVLADTVHGGTVTATSPVGTTLSGSLFSPSNSPSPGTDFASGILNFHIGGITPGGAVDLTITPSSQQAWEDFYLFGPSPSEPYGWYGFLYQHQTDSNDASTTVAEFLPNGQIVLHLVDGGRGDNNFESLDGEIAGQGGPAITHVTPVVPDFLASIAGDVISQQITYLHAHGSVTFSATDLPDGLSIDPQTGLITGTIALSTYYPQSLNAQITVSDGVDTNTVGFYWYVNSTALPNVIELPHPSGTGIIEISAPQGTYFYSVSIVPTAGVELPSGAQFPVGFFSFALGGLEPGQAVDVTFTGIDASQVTDYFKYGPTAADTGDHWYDFLFSQQTDADSALGTGMEIVDGNTFVLHLVDGGRGDDNLSADGVIYDIGGPAISTPEALGTQTLVTSDHGAGATYGDLIHFTATVSAASGTPTGSVQFTIDGQNFGTPKLLVNGEASIDISSLSAVDHAIEAIYASDKLSFSNSSDDLTQHVDPALLTVTAADKTKAYGAALPTLTANITGFVNSETSAVLTVLPTLGTTATASSHVGTYAITASGAAAANYTFKYVAGSLDVTPVGLTIKADNQTKAYGAALPTLTATYTGLVNGDTPSSLATPPTLSTTATASSHVASYTITASGAVDNDYTISYQSGTLSVTPVGLTIKADNPTKSYGATLPILTATYTGLVNGDTPASLATLPTLSTAATASSHVGSYTISASGAVDNDYTISYQSGTLSVTPVGLTIKADNQTKPYGAALPTFTATYTGLVNGDTPANLPTKPTLSTTATAASHVGSYTISASGAVDTDYTISYQSGTLSVTPVGLMIKADNQTKPYGAALPTLTATYTGLVNGDTPASLPTKPTLATTASAASHVGGYTITASGAVDDDYTISYQSGTLSVTPVGLTIKADNKTKAYGDAVMPTLTAKYTGLVNGDTPASLTTLPTFSTAATAASHVASYTITASGAVDNDYTISYQSGTLSVTPVGLTIKADNQTKPYGAAIPTLTATYTGLVNGDTPASLPTKPTLSTTATAASHVASYTITASGAVDNDYTISYQSGLLSVTPVGLTITAEDKTKLYGGAVPALTAKYSGFVNGDTPASLTTQPTLLTTATSASPVANYPINASGAVDNDYTIGYVAGSLSVTPAPLNIKADDKTKVTGTMNPPLTFTATGFVNGDTAASLTTQPTLTTTATTTSPPGPYSITASGAASANYTIGYTAGTLTVTPAGNQPPVARDDVVTVTKNTDATINVLSNDSDPDGSINVASLTIVSNPKHGKLKIDSKIGIVTYTPDKNYLGADSFTYKVKDNAGAYSNVATVSLTITAPNLAPTARDDQATTAKNAPVTINVLANDNDSDGTIDARSVAIVSGPKHGTVTTNLTTGAVTYTPAKDYVGEDKFTYKVKDNQGTYSNVASVSVKVTAPHQPPQAADDSATTKKNKSAAISVLANDRAFDGTIDVSTLVIIDGPKHGTVKVDKSGVVTYTPDKNYTGSEKFTYKVKDNCGVYSNVATVNVTVSG